MRVLTAKCPYCGSDVDATMDKLSEPVDCPRCRRPFEIEVPSVEVAAVREIREETAEQSPTLVQEPGEREIIKTHPAMFRAHPIRFTLCLMLVAAGLVGALWAWNSPTPYLMWIAAACAATGVLLLAVWRLMVMATTLTVTDRRTILRRGLISRATSEVEHEDVRNVQMDQSVFERLFRVGDIGISSSGQDDLEIVARSIPNPTRVVAIIRENQS